MFRSVRLYLLILDLFSSNTATDLVLVNMPLGDLNLKTFQWLEINREDKFLSFVSKSQLFNASLVLK